MIPTGLPPEIQKAIEMFMGNSEENKNRSVNLSLKVTPDELIELASLLKKLRDKDQK